MTDPKEPDGPPSASASTVRSDRGELDVTIPLPSGSGPGGLLGRRYQILAELGRGAEGAVYKVRDRHADEIVALKLLDDVREGSEELARLRRELANARKITHPGIVRLHDLVEIDGRWALSMQLVEGSSLEARIESRRAFAPEELVALARRLAEALAAAHAAGVTHRDLKPANILLHADGRPVVSDFGISRSHSALVEEAGTTGASTAVARTQAGAIVGTPLFMAPEQLRGEPATPAVDVYAFGLILHEAATGEVPLLANSLPELRELRGSTPAPTLATRRPDLPTFLVEAVDRCLATDPALRFRDGAELLRALEEPGASVGTAVPPPAPGPPTAPRARHLTAWIAGGVAIAASLAIAATQALLRAPPADLPGSSVVPVVEASAPPTGFRLVARAHRRVTFGDGCEEFPTFLRDGKRVVFDGSIGAKSHLFALDLDGGTLAQLTTSPGWDLAATASPTTDEVVFLRYDEDLRAAYRLDLATKEVRFLIEGTSRPAFTPDGRHVWAGDRSRPSRIEVATGRVVETLPMPDGQKAWALRELPAGDVAASFPTHVEGGRGGLWLASGPAGARAWRELTRDGVSEMLTLAPDAKHLVTGRILPTTTELVAIPVAGGPLTSLATSSISPGKGISFAPDGTRLVWSTCRDSNTVEPFDRRGTDAPPGSSDDFDGAAMPDGRVVVISTRDGSVRPWVLDAAGRDAPRPLRLDIVPTQVEVSPDGHSLVFATQKGIVVVDAAATNAPTVVTTNGADRSPSFRDGGREIVFAREVGGAPTIMSVSTAGGDARALGVAGSEPAPIPGSGDLVYLAAEGVRVQPRVWSARTGASRPLSPSLPAGRYGRPAVSPEGRLVSLSSRGVEVVVVDLASGRVLRREAKAGDQIDRSFFDPQGRLFTTRARWIGDLWAADLDARP